MQYPQIKKKRQDDTNKLFTDLGVFWAFSNEQFDKNKTPLQPEEKYIDIGAGGFMPKHNYQALKDGLKAIENTFKAEIKDAKAREEHILYELNNHEAGITGDITDTLDALGEDYTAEEVQKVFNNNHKLLYA